MLLFVPFGTIYATVQQSQRSDANSPQIQMAEDTSAALNGGGEPLAFTFGKVDMKTSLAPFTIIYDKKGNVVAGSGYLNGKVPKPPLGTLTASNGQTYSAVTWEPQDNVRIASVTVAAKNYYVLSGRSLTEVEKNEAKTLELAFAGLVVSIMLLGLVYVLSGLSTEY